MTDRELENFYRESLEEDIVHDLSQSRNISLDEAMSLYYNSRLANRIYYGECGIQYLDHTILAKMVEDEVDGKNGAGE